MPPCDYCDREFDDEESYLEHLADEHYDELDRIDRRRVDDLQDDGGVSTRAIAGVGVVVALLVVAGGAFALLGGDDGGAGVNAADRDTDFTVERQPQALGSQHIHGNIEVRIGDRSFDFSQQQYQLQDDYFHFEGGGGDRWHVHATGVTLQYAMATLGIGVEEDRVIYEGEVYHRDDPGVELRITVNGQPVDPATYILEDGDRVQIVVNTSS